MKKENNTTVKNLLKQSKLVKKTLLTISHNAKVGHIGSALSIADIVTVLYFKILNVTPKTIKNTNRDRFILSKGHAVTALYSALYHAGFINRKTLNSYCKNGGLLGEHPEHKTLGIELSTGSLGHGLSVASGISLAGKIDQKKYKVYVLISDAECNEGEIWQSALFASHHKLNNLITIIDHNRVQAFGDTQKVMNLEPLKEKWASFGWDVIQIDGHNLEALLHVFSLLKVAQEKPTVIIANTVRGKGVSFMEHKLEWHYLTTSTEEHIIALKEIKNNK